jgi:hypothetical protein
VENVQHLDADSVLRDWIGCTRRRIGRVIVEKVLIDDFEAII